MDLALTDEQRELVTSFAGLLAKQSPPERVRAAEPGGFDEALWRSLVEVGAVAMAVPEAGGGWGAGLLDLALVAEQAGRALASAPMVEAQVAARLLAAAGAAGAEALVGVLEGSRLVTLAVRPASGGVATLVPGAAVADAAVVPAGDRLLLVPLGDANRRPVPNLGSAPLADVTVPDDAPELARGAAATRLHEAALDEWLALTAAAVVGIGAVAHELTCAYARERQAWGVPIGSFQGVAHPLADSATALDGARLLACKAAWSLDGARPRARELAAIAFAFASESARDATYRGIHFHGGYGFMLEQDVQLYYRRARAWPRVWGDPAAAYRRAAEARYAPATPGGASPGTAPTGTAPIGVAPAASSEER